MANYYHEARAHVRRLKAYSEETKRRAERRAEYAGAKAEHPVNVLMAEGRGVTLHTNNDLYHQIEDGTGMMIPWNGEPDCMIDRYDGRALIDFIPLSRVSSQPRSQKQREMEELVLFEAYRDLIRMKSLGLPEDEILELVEKESVEMRAAAKVAAAQAVHHPYSEFNGSQTASNISSGLTVAYGTTAAMLEDGPSSDESPSDAETPRQRGKKGSRVLNRELMDRIGRDEIGIRDFSHKLKRVMKMEGETEALKELRAARPRRIRQRTRTSQQSFHPDSTLHSLGRSHSASFPHRSRYRADSSRGMGQEGRGQRCSESEGEDREVPRGRLEYITEFHGDGTSEESTDLAELPSTREAASVETIHDLPPEPNRLGYEERTEARKRREEERHHLEQLRSDATARELLRECKKARHKESVAKETPQERLKRLTAAQLNNQAKKDTLQTKQKRIQEARDRATRLQNERSASNRD